MLLMLLILFPFLFYAILRIAKVELLSPASLAIIYWCFFVFAGFLAFTGYGWQFLSSLWIMIACLAFALGYSAVYIIKRSSSSTPKTLNLENRTINMSLAIRSLWFCIGLGFVYIVMKLDSYDINIGTLLSPELLLEANNRIAVMRYSGEVGVSFILQFFLTFIYTAPLLGGFTLPFAAKRRDKILAFATLLPAFISFAISNEKAILLVCIVFWIAAFIVGFLARNRRLPKVSTKHATLVFAGIIVLLSMFIFSMMMRIGTVDIETLEVVLNKFISSYAFGHMPAFDSVFTNIRSDTSLTLGGYTFYGISDSLQIMERIQGVYQDYFVFGDTNANVYTLFRGVILDYGYFGSLLVISLVGAACSFAVLQLKYVKKPAVFSQLVLVMLYALIMYSFVISIFSYMSLIATFVLFGIFLFVVQTRLVK